MKDELAAEHRAEIIQMRRERLRVGDGTSGMTLLGEGTHLRFIVDRERFSLVLVAVRARSFKCLSLRLEALRQSG